MNNLKDNKYKIIITATIIVAVLVIVFVLVKFTSKNKTAENNDNMNSSSYSQTDVVSSAAFLNIPESPVDEFDFVVTAENEICITKYKGNDNKVRLPEYINSLPVTSINRDVFAANEAIRTFIFDENFKRINNNECKEGTPLYLDGCKNLSTVYFGKNTTKIDEDYFDYCEMLENIYVSDENLYYKSIDGMVYSKDETEFILCPQKTLFTEIKLSDSCRIVRNYAFEQCLGIEVLNLNKANDIGELCFSGREIYMLGDCKVTQNTIANDVAKKISIKFVSVISTEMREYCTEKGISFSYAE